MKVIALLLENLIKITGGRGESYNGFFPQEIIRQMWKKCAFFTVVITIFIFTYLFRKRYLHRSRGFVLIDKEDRDCR